MDTVSQQPASKQLDFTITHDILRGYGTAIKDCAQRIAAAITEARQDGVTVSVSGVDEVDLTDFGTELQQAANLLQVGISSPTLRKEIHQRLAMKYLSDARQEIKTQVAQEIESHETN